MQLGLPIAADGAPALVRPTRRVSRSGSLIQASTAATYDAGSTARRVARWQVPTVSPNAGILASLGLMRDRSRAAVRNDGYAKGAIDKLVTNIIGDGIVPSSSSTDATFRALFDEAFLAWTDESDADGALDFYGQQGQVCRGWLEAGEVFVRLRPRLPGDGLTVPLQLQVLEPELCPYGHNVHRLPNGNRIRAGIEFNGIGRKVAYWFFHQRPGAQEDFDANDLRRVPADRVIHVFDPLRPGQLRGVPHLSAALLRLNEVLKMDDASLLRVQLANMFVGTIKRQQVDGGDELATNPLTGRTHEDDDTLATRIDLEPGIVQELAPGEELDFNEPPDAGANYPDYMRVQLRAAATAAGVPYEVLTGDMSGVNDRTVRAILLEFRRRLTGYQHQIIVFQFCRRVMTEWLTQAYLSGALPMPGFETTPKRFTGVTWTPHAWPYINPLQDVQTAKAEVRAGFKSRAGIVAERGGHVDVVDAEQAADNARAAELGLVHDSNPAVVANSGAAQPDAPAPAPNPSEETQ